MAKAYNPVPSILITKTLQDAGFKRLVVGKEICYERANHNLSSLVVRVYTSAKENGGGVVAEKGKDAIRSVLLYRPKGSDKTRCVKKASRVYRVGETKDILNRMLERARELYGFANRMAKVPPCNDCGAPCYFESKKCSVYCYKN